MLLDDPKWGYAGALRRAGFLGEIIAVQADPEVAVAMRASRRALLDRCAPAAAAPTSLVEGDIYEWWERVAPRMGAADAGLLMDFCGPWDAEKLSRCLDKGGRPGALTITAPSGRGGPSLGTQEAREKSLRRLLEPRGLALESCVGYPGGGVAGAGRRTTGGQPMMYYTAVPPARRSKRLARRSTRLGPLNEVSTVYRPRRAVPRRDGQYHVSWWGYGDSCTVETAEWVAQNSSIGPCAAAAK